MSDESLVTIPDIPVMYVSGERGKPISEQAPEAFRKLEEKLPSLKGRRFYGTEFSDQYWACVAIQPDDDHDALPHLTWVIPGGKYARRRIPDWEKNLHLIEPTFKSLLSRTDLYPSRPWLEYYRSQSELHIMVPVH